MLRRSLRLALCLAATAGLAAPLFAQSRFELLSRDALTDASGLRIVVVRDNQLSSCFALFTMDPPAAPPPAEVVVTPSPADIARQQSIERIRRAAEKRDLQLAALNAEFTKRAGRPYDSLTSNANYAVDPVLIGNYEQDRRRINEAYDNVLWSEIPGSYPYAVPYPGMRTGGWEDAANAVRRAMVDPDPSSAMKTMATQFARIDEALRRLNEVPRLAVSGPFACNGNIPPPRR
jgi:hypothetical protein